MSITTSSIWMDPKAFDAALYRDARSDYPQEFFEKIKKYLTKKGREPGDTIAFNIGCGPGKGCAGLSKNFTKVYASDPSHVQLSEAPYLENVVYERYTSNDLIEKYEAGIADFCFFGLSFHFTGTEAGTQCAKHLLKKDAPSLMSASGYHLGYIVDPSSIPQAAFDLFEKIEKGEIIQAIPGINNSPRYVEDVTSSYPDYTRKSLYRCRHYPALAEASEFVDKLIDLLTRGPGTVRRDEEFMKEEMDFTYQEKNYLHTIEKTNTRNLFMIVASWYIAARPERKQEYEDYKNEFCEKLGKILNLKDPNEPFYHGRIYYNYLCSDTIKFD